MPSQSDWSGREQDLRRQFNDLIPALAEWGASVDATLLTILAKNNFDPHGIQMLPQHRVKAVDSFVSKALYRPKSKDYNNPLLDIKDKVATRLVVLTIDQVELVGKLLADYPDWEAEIDREISNDGELGPTAFGYQSLHVLVKQKESPNSKPNILLNNIVCEIQIRTLLQHAYAEVSHGTVYKGSYKYEPIIQRKLARSMALIEAVDEYFQTMFSLINSQELAASAFSKEMNARFATLWPSFDKEQVDVSLFSYLFDTIYDPTIFDTQIIDTFVTQNERDLKRIIQRNKYYISHQPIVIFVAYLLKNRPDMIHKRWELDKSILEDIAKEMGISTEEYD